MTDIIEKEIENLVNLETHAWDTQNIKPFLEIIHKDMVWPFPPTSKSHDPVDWIFVMGRFDYDRWNKIWQDIFDTHTLSHNIRNLIKIKVSNEGDAAFAVVDIDTLWIHKESKNEFRWFGRVCKMYTKMSDGKWLFISQTGALEY